jgi:hypothetical protein
MLYDTSYSEDGRSNRERIKAMSDEQILQVTTADDEIYIEIWKAEQKYIGTRWNNVTFFIGISFAILGFSFQDRLMPNEALAIRISGVILYWFAYAFYLHFYTYTRFLRAYLIKMETVGRTKHNIQSMAQAATSAGINKHLATRKMLLYFGVIYLLGIIMLFLLHL